ncbi:MAG TPA: DUF6798 domain-containing protein, partial [Rhodothermales bacterium]|nr:DUF6798 domain-containing protein [Rhodothermales bacterium]
VTGLVVALALGLFLLGGALPALRDRGVRARSGPVLFGVVFALVAAPFVLPVLLGQAGEGAAGVPSGYALYVRLRLPHHLLPTAFGWTTWARFGLLALAGGAFLVWLSRRGVLSHGTAVARFVAVVAVLCLLATVGVVGLESLAVARVQAFKLTVLLVALFTVGACGGVAEAITLLPKRLRRWAESPIAHPLRTTTGVAVLGLLVLALAVLDVGRPGALYQPRAHARSDWGHVEAWARTRTPEDALFIVPPTNATFRVGAHRGVVATWKAHPFRSDAMRLWLARLRTVAPAPLPDLAHGDGRGYGVRLDSAYCANSPEAWRTIGQRTGARFAVVEAGCGRPVGAPVFRSGALAVYPLR